MLFPLEGNQKLGPLDLNHQFESTFRGPTELIQSSRMTQVSTLLSLEIQNHYIKEALWSKKLQSHINFLFFILDITYQEEAL